MSRNVVLVHPDDAVAAAIAEALRRCAYSVWAFSDPINALSFVELTPPDALVTAVRFGAGKLHGIALSLMAGLRRPGLKALLLVEPRDRVHTDPLGEYLPAPGDPSSVVEVLDRLFGTEAITV